ncbi:pyrroline-5-carboxylate reductase [Metabacillus schmidteae]|uniref:pyrroline-5-carboxylate reductase n=1 Tax=Metabacillus schmidteae TaxID=2730405 RepID=UPI0022A7B18B|nr:pyrroline-5-carboxylate reductase [Metabacillus schmidteae]
MKNSILFIGAGRMAEAIIAGLITSSHEQINSIYVSNQKNTERLQELATKYQVQPIDNYDDIIEKVDMIVLAMPPSEHEGVLNKLKHLITSQFVVTVAAGISPSFIERYLPGGTAVGWIMPNTAAMVKHSISLYTYGSSVSEKHHMQMELLVNSIGTSLYCSEEEIHNLTAITGSAPAFLYLFVESLIEQTEQYNVSRETAEKLVKEMVFGSVEMLKGNYSPKELREQVTTPGGATAEGIKILRTGNFVELLQEAVIATNKKAKGEN